MGLGIGIGLGLGGATFGPDGDDALTVGRHLGHDDRPRVACALKVLRALVVVPQLDLLVAAAADEEEAVVRDVERAWLGLGLGLGLGVGLGIGIGLGLGLGLGLGIGIGIGLGMSSVQISALSLPSTMRMAFISVTSQ